ncbi:hypothetical protein [Variovorax paradoxus]|uniref:Sulfotransferase family protein n=3 Tax=Variovorax paradoxus TaxID=34073 RepID=A0AAW8EM18_VARPD|nr:hypothetical protein [Variovorax paradoxus]MDP9973682.1 hypothetical protein [Variovorax paradoxus]
MTPARKNHLMIAGTGRAGTTFLVQYLAACGLDTHLARHPDASTYNEDANAGLEDLPFDNPDLPYVIKSPWLHAYATRLLADPSIALDAVIFPMRSIVEASTSRVVNELRARYAMEGLPDDCRLWESWGTTPGGIVYSLNPIDEARLLALGFHELMHTLVKHDVPLVMLDFPRLVEDPAYLYDKLHPVLGAKLDRERALSAHRETAVPSKVRVGRELAAHTAQAPASIEFPSQATLDRVAIKRELDKAVSERAVLQRKLDEAMACRAEQQRELDEAIAGRTACQQHLSEAIAERDARQHELAECQRSQAVLAQDLERARLRTSHLEAQCTALRASNSWRVTAPLRTLSRMLKIR